jgi:hypothetical protein
MWSENCGTRQVKVRECSVVVTRVRIYCEGEHVETRIEAVVFSILEMPKE